MDVSFYATLRPIVGQETVSLELPAGANVGQLLDAVLERFPAMREELVDDNGALFPHVHLFINGRDAPLLQDGMDTVLKTSDSIDLFPAVAGG